MLVFWSLVVSLVAAESPLLSLEETSVSDTLNILGSNVFDTNEGVSDLVRRLSEKPYFSTYKIDLNKNLCPFVDDTGTCGNRACAIETIEEDVPWEYQSQYLGKLRKDSTTKAAPGCVKEDIFAYSSHDYCLPEDEDNVEGVWVDLVENKERYTGYGGSHAHKVWNAVYQENCFGYVGEECETTPCPVNQLGNVFDDRHARQELGGEAGQLALNMEQQCIEQRLFYRLLSGMHASISTHLSYDYLNQTTGEWGPNLDEFMRRVGNHPERLNNLLFNHVLVSRAIGKLKTYLQLLSFSSSCPAVDTEVRFDIHRLAFLLSKGGRGINETLLFSSPEGQALKDEFRKRVRNVNALMSCVGCERCHLWGNIQTAGYGTALKLLFELPEDPNEDPARVTEVMSRLKRSELVALVQTFARLSHSVDALQYFSQAYKESKINIKSFSYQFSLIMAETRVALIFILKSYVNFPKNLWKYFIFQANIYWNHFISRKMTLTFVESLSS